LLAGVGGALIALLAAGAVAAGASIAAPSAPTEPCPHASTEAADATVGELRASTLCVINRARARAGVDPLTRNHRLTQVAQRHTRRMLAQDCFEHHCDGEAFLPKRLRRSGYLEGAESWRYAEVLGYDDTAKAMVAAWLAEDDLAADLVSPKYDQVGLGIKTGAPEPGVDGANLATFTIDLGSRRPAP
jgi:uncharacterized protein YkwD